jgi:diguanylate cyclase (GGDEF)-like protein
VGTLCIIDRQPREFSPEDAALLRDLAAMVEDELSGLRSATTDSLTGVSNRRGFEILANKALALSRRLDGASTLLAFDLDGFKEINDVFGHSVGDQALVDFANALLRTFRDADVIARLGGDEFCVLACGPKATMGAPIARLEKHLAQPSKRPYTLAFSVGMAEYAKTHTSFAELLVDADHAMFEHKRSQRGT